MPTKTLDDVDLRATVTPAAKSRISEVVDANAAMLAKQAETASRFRCTSCTSTLFMFYQMGHVLERDMSNPAAPQLGMASVTEATAVCQGCNKRYAVEM